MFRGVCSRVGSEGCVCLFEFRGGCALVSGLRGACLLGFEGSDRVAFEGVCIADSGAERCV